MDLATLPHWQLLIVDVVGIGAAVGAMGLAVGMAVRDLRREAKAARDLDEKEATRRKLQFELHQQLIAARRGTRAS